MLLKKWSELPDRFHNDKVEPYYKELKKHTYSLICKRLFDIIFSLLLLIVLSPVLLIISLLVKLDSNGPVFYRQVRVTQFGREFSIFKFRTMIQNADKVGSLITVNNDLRVTKIGGKLRGCRLDEIPQLINILIGDMSFVGTRPEVVKYVNSYSDEMLATLLLPAGVTSKASIEYKDENELLANSENADETYINTVLPKKMEYNLNDIKNYSFWGDINTMFKTFFSVIK